jgi:hypothetical protein
MFVLALTILGLSLFSLSSFEAQFLSRSNRNTQALYDAMSGIEWARTVLARERRLEAVAPGEPAASTRPARVVSVEAWQNGNTSGSIDFTGNTPVRIRALGDDGRYERRMVESTFDPQLPNSLYRNLIDSYTYLKVNLVDVDGDDRITWLDGRIRANDSSFNGTWLGLSGPPIDAGVGVPSPDVASFFANHLYAPFTIPINGPAGIYTVPGVLGQPTFFRPLTPHSPQISVYEAAAFSPAPKIFVTGTCVWLLPNGMRFDRPVDVIGTSDARLVIVAQQMGNASLGKSDGNWTGVWFFAGINSISVPVVLVSDAQISITHSDQTTTSSETNNLSIFGSMVFLQGPKSPKTMKLHHPPQMDAVIDELAAMGALPNVSGGAQSTFKPIPGSWRELDPDNPS